MKRCFDVICSLILLVILAPVIGVVAFLIRIKLGSPVIFVQQRPGLNMLPFHIYKFRTMTSAKDSNGVLLPDRLRLTRLGLFLRRFSLDEFPQLFNVLQGHLSLVGPRPLLMEYLERYSPEQLRRHDVNPGITGWAQVNGRNSITWEEKFALDVWYVDHQSFLLDMKILWLTFFKVFQSRGISEQGHVTMTEFRGYEEKI